VIVHPLLYFVEMSVLSLQWKSKGSIWTYANYYFV